MMPGLQNTANSEEHADKCHWFLCDAQPLNSLENLLNISTNLLQRSVRGIMMLLQGVALITAYVFAFAPTFRHPAQTRQK